MVDDIKTDSNTKNQRKRYRAGTARWWYDNGIWDLSTQNHGMNRYIISNKN